MKQTYTLATSEFCGPCKIVKQYIADHKLDIAFINMEDNIEFFAKHDIKSVPVLLNSDGTRYSGMDMVLGHLSGKNVTC